MANDQANMSSTIPEFLVWPMKNELRLITAVVIALALVSSSVADAAPSRPLVEYAAVALIVRPLKHDRVYAKRISLGCLTYDTEETTMRTFSSRFARNTTPSVAEIPKRVRWSPVTAFIGGLEKSTGGNRLTIAGI